MHRLHKALLTVVFAGSMLAIAPPSQGAIALVGLDCGLEVAEEWGEYGTPGQYTGVLTGGPFDAPGTEATMICEVSVNGYPDTTFDVPTVDGSGGGAMVLNIWAPGSSDYVEVCTRASWRDNLGVRRYYSRCDVASHQDYDQAGSNHAVRMYIKAQERL